MFSTNSTPISGRSAWRQVTGSLLVALVLASCGTSSGSTGGSTLSAAPPDSGVPLGPPEVVVPEPIAVPPGDAELAEQQLATVSRTVLEELLRATGASSITPDAVQRTIDLDRSLQAEATAFAVGELDELAPSDQRAGFSRSPMVRGGALDAAVFGLGILYSTVGLALSRAEDRPPPSDGPTPAPDEDHVSVDGGTIAFRINEAETATDENGVTTTGTYEVAAVLAACPDSSGSVVGRFSADATIVMSNGGLSSTANYRMSIDLTAAVDPMAEMTGYDMQITGSAGQTARSTTEEGTEIEGFYIEGGHSATLTGAAVRDDLQVTGVSGPGILRSSSIVTGAQQQAFMNHQHNLAVLLSALVLGQAENFWRSGACIDVTLQPSGDPEDVGGFETIDLAVAATSSQDQAPIVGTALPTVSAGTGTVAPTGPTDVPTTFAYTAPSDAKPSTVDVEVRSRRGIGKASMSFTGPQGYVVDGKLEVLEASGTKCGALHGEWSLDLSANFEGASFTGSVSFTLDPSTLRGTYRLVGTTTYNGLVLPQQGSGEVSFVAAADGSAELVFKGSAYAGGGYGEHSVEVRTTTSPC